MLIVLSLSINTNPFIGGGMFNLQNTQDLILLFWWQTDWPGGRGCSPRFPFRLSLFGCITIVSFSKPQCTAKSRIYPSRWFPNFFIFGLVELISSCSLRKFLRFFLCTNDHRVDMWVLYLPSFFHTIARDDPDFPPLHLSSFLWRL